MFKKFILFFILLIIFLSLGSFFFSVYNLQKEYFKNKAAGDIATENGQVSEEVDNEIPSSYSIYSKELYEKALSENRVVLLFFNANWCSECIQQSEVNKIVFNELEIKGVVGLESHILDSETTVELDSLAKKFDVKKENSFIILDKNGAVAYRYVGNIEKELLSLKIMEVGDIK